MESTAPTQLHMSCQPVLVQTTHSRPPSTHSSLFTTNIVDYSIISRGQRIRQLVEPNTHARDNNDPMSRSVLGKLDLTSGTVYPSCSGTFAVLSTTSFVFLLEHD